MVQNLGPKYGTSAFEGLMSGLGKGVGTGIQDMIKKKQESNQVNALTSVLAPYLSDEQKQGLEGMNMEGAKALMTAYAPIMKQMQKGDNSRNVLSNWGIGGNGNQMQANMEDQQNPQNNMEEGQPQGMMQQQNQQTQPEQQQNQLSTLLQNPQFISQLQATNPELLKSYQETERFKLDQLKANEPIRKENIEKKIQENVFDSFDSLLKTGDIGFYGNFKTPFRFAGPKWQERQAEFSTLSRGLEGELLARQSKGALSQKRFDYLVKQLPTRWDSVATIKGKLKGFKTELGVIDKTFNKTGTAVDKISPQIEKQFDSYSKQSKVKSDAPYPNSPPPKAGSGQKVFWDPKLNNWVGIPNSAVQEYMKENENAIRG